MNPSPLKRRFVMLDRDGTLIVERHYLSDPEQVELLPGAVEGLQRLMRLKLGLIIITNQSGIGRGYFTQTRVDDIHQRLRALLADYRIILDGIYVCPHVPEDNCSCRKPRSGLVSAAAAQLDFEPSAGFVIGDKPCDIELGRAIKARTFLIRRGHGEKDEDEGTTRSDYIVDDLVDVAKIIEQLVAG